VGEAKREGFHAVTLLMVGPGVADRGGHAACGRSLPALFRAGNDEKGRGALRRDPFRLSLP